MWTIGGKRRLAGHIASDPLGIEVFPTKAGSVCKPIPGFDVQILSESGDSLGANEQGDVTVKLLLPPGCLSTVWGRSSEVH